MGNDGLFGSVMEDPELVAASGGGLSSYWEVGKTYFLRTVTMYTIGVLESAHPNALVFRDACWIADTGEYQAFLHGQDPEVVEWYQHPIMVNPYAIVDATERPLPARKAKSS